MVNSHFLSLRIHGVCVSIIYAKSIYTVADSWKGGGLAGVTSHRPH